MPGGGSEPNKHSLHGVLAERKMPMVVGDTRPKNERCSRAEQNLSGGRRGNSQEGTERERKSWFAAVEWLAWRAVEFQNTTRRNVKDK